ncbi:MAG: trimeric intracellular cation channel family protein [Gammaproteobacteria bacterium]|jgi:uncharacterized membrane protein YeiH
MTDAVWVLHLADMAGVAVFAVSGALSAGRKSLDLLGVFVIAAITAIGGGTLRDLLLDRHPIFWLQRPVYLGIIGAAALVTVLYTRFRAPPRYTLGLADACGLAVFTVSGARIAEAAGFAWPVILLMGAMTGAAGGVMRDLLTGEIPLILRRDVYATACIAGVFAYLGSERLALAAPLPTLAGLMTVVLLRIAAIVYGLHLPQFRVRE